jgi:hypothetical protein
MLVPQFSFGTGEDTGGGGEIHLDYEDKYDEEHTIEDTHTVESKKEMDFTSLETPVKYKIGIWLNNVGKIEKESGVYELDFWYFVESDDVNFLEVGVPSITFVNGKSIKSDTTFTDEHYHEERIRGTFFNKLDWKAYPFEQVDLNIEMEPDMPYHIENAVFTLDVNKTGIDEQVNVVGWEIRNPTFEIVEHNYEDWHSFSRFVATIHIERTVTGALLKTFLPATVIVGVSLLIFYIPENFTPRIYLTAPLLLALVFLHRGALSELPTLSYMTIFDKVIVIYYAIMANNIISLAIQMKFHTLNKDPILIKKINRYMLLIVPGIVLALVVLLFPL